MQLKDITKPITEQSDEELLDRLREVRHRREVARPVAKRKAAKAEKKAVIARGNKLDKMLAALSPEEQASLLAQLESGETK